MYQLTTRAVERDPLRNRAPHFLCGSLTEEDSTLTVNTPLPDTPFPMKKSTNEWSNAPRSIRGFVSVTNQEKRAKEEQSAKAQASDEHALGKLFNNLYMFALHHKFSRGASDWFPRKRI